MNKGKRVGVTKVALLIKIRKDDKELVRNLTAVDD